MLFIHLFLLMISFLPQKPTVYQFKVPSIDGGTIDFAQFKGKKILIVNTASHCGYTPQYEGLEKLYEQYKDKLVIVGFPSNDFLWQEPGSNETIKEFCSEKYNVTFPMASKIHVRGWSKAPIYQWLTSKEKNGVENSSVSWNFNKYLINENGEYVHHYSSDTKPDDAELMKAILN